MKFLTYFNTNFWNIIFWFSILVLFAGHFGLFQLSETDKLYHGLVAIISLATSDIIKQLKCNS